MGNKIQRIYIGDHNQIRPIWKPTSSTLAYYPFRNNLNDYSGNGKNLTGTATFSDNKVTTANGLDGATVLCGTQGAFTVSFWAAGTGNGFMYDYDGGGALRACSSTGNSQYSLSQGSFIINNSWRRAGSYSAAGTASDFVLMTAVYTGSQLSVYINGTQSGTVVSTSGNVKSSATGFKIEGGTWGEVIIEKKAWTVDEIQDYYNQTKGKYLGIS